MVRNLSSGLQQVVAPTDGGQGHVLAEATSAAASVTDSRPAEDMGLRELLAEDGV